MGKGITIEYEISSSNQSKISLSVALVSHTGCYLGGSGAKESEHVHCLASALKRRMGGIGVRNPDSG